MMIDVSPSLLIGRGYHRECYIHPENSDLCIKIFHKENRKKFRREIKYYKYLQRRNISWEMLARFHGVVETNLGPGSVFDLIRDYDNNISARLDNYMSCDEFTLKNLDQLKQALIDLKEYILCNKLIVRSMSGTNVLYKRTSETTGRLVLIDQIYDTHLMPTPIYTKYFAKKKAMKKLVQLKEKLTARHPDNPLLPLLQDLFSVAGH